MFFPSKRPAVARISQLAGLRRSMNTPVVAIEELPSGPASAAVALHALPGDRVEVSVAVRSERTGQLAFYTADPELTDLKSAGIAVDAALSFAESMGFLFDDDEVEIRGAGGPTAAAAIWSEFIGAESEPDAELESALLESEPGPPRPVGSDPFGPMDIEGPLFVEPPRRSPPAPSPTPAAPTAAGSPDPREAEAEGDLPFWLTIPNDESENPDRATAPSAAPAASPLEVRPGPKAASRRDLVPDSLPAPTQPVLSDAPGADWAEELACPEKPGPSDASPLRVERRTAAPVERAVGERKSAAAARQSQPAPEDDPDSGGDSASRDLLLDVLAQTSVERVCPSGAPERRLSKFRWRGTNERLLAALTEPAVSETTSEDPGAASDGDARDTPPRASLRLRLLSRF